MKGFHVLLVSIQAIAAMTFISCTSVPGSRLPGASHSSLSEPEGTEVSPVLTSPAGEVVLLDDFEEGNYWVAVADSWREWGVHDYAVTAETTRDWCSSGVNSGDWTFTRLSTGGMATFFTDQLTETDWSAAHYLVLNAKNPNGSPVKLSFSCQTTDSWLWTQSSTFEVPTGDCLVVFDLTKGLIDGSNKKIQRIPGATEVKRAMIHVVSAAGAGHLLVDNIRLVK